MHEAYSRVRKETVSSLQGGGKCLDDSAHAGHEFGILREMPDIDQDSYLGIEWNRNLVLGAQQKNLHVVRGDLNKEIRFRIANSSATRW